MGLDDAVEAPATKEAEMPYAYVVDFPGATLEQYDEAGRRMEREGSGGHTPQGGLHHAAGAYEGGLRVIDVWESREAFGSFVEGTLKPLVAELGLGEPRVREIELYAVREGPASDPAFVQVFSGRGVGAEAYEAVNAEVLEDGELPAAVVWHVAGPTEDGWCVIDAWTSREERDRFIQDRVVPLLEGRLDGPPQLEDLEVHGTMTAAPEAARPAS